MKNSIESVKMKFDKLAKGEKILAFMVFCIILGGILFNAGVEIGKAVYEITEHSF